MKVKEETINELEKLNPDELMMVYDLILSFKRRKPKQKAKERSSAYIRVRNALKQCKGPLSRDILSDREERI